MAILAVALTLAAGVGHLAFDRSPRSSVLAVKALLALVALAAAGFGRARLHRLLGAEPPHERTAPAWVIPPEPPPNFTFTPDVRRAAAVQAIALAVAAVASVFLR